MAEQQQNPLLIPIAIVIAGAIIGGALYFGGTGDETGNQVAGTNEPDLSEIKVEITRDDHIFGDPNAPIKIVEFSDTECPFCKSFHASLNEVLPEYEGQVAWVYRHLPLAQLHRKAPREAEATECAAALGGNDAFWAYTNRLFEITPSNDGLEDSQLPEIAEFAGLDREAFVECLDSGEMTSRVTEDANGAVSLIQQFVDLGLARGVGTPFSVIVNEDGEVITPIPGFVRAPQLRQVFDQALQEVE